MHLRGSLLRFCQDIACGMSYLSTKGFIHRDLAARNVLLDGNTTCKVSEGIKKLVWRPATFTVCSVEPHNCNSHKTGQGSFNF